MDMTEEWIKQSTVPKGDFIVISYTENIDGTKIILESDDYLTEIFFDGATIFSRRGLESFMMQTWSKVQIQYNDRYFFRNHFFYEVLNSKLVCWIKEESQGFYDDLKIRHYSIVTSNEIVDILASFEPIVTVFDKTE